MSTIKKKHEWLFALGGFGTSLISTFMSAALLARYMPGDKFMDSGTGMYLIFPMLFAVMMFAARMLDGIFDLPIAAIVDKYNLKYGRRWPLILIGLVPMLIAFILVWIPPMPETQSYLNVVWVVVFSIIFYFFYTFVAVPFLSYTSDMAPDKQSRTRIASWQAFFNTIGYSLVYAVFIGIFTSVGKGTFAYQDGIMKVALMLSPMALLMLIPVFVIFIRLDKKKTKEELSAMAAAVNKDDMEKLSVIKSLKTAFKNKSFRQYLYVLACFFFGLQLFLGGMTYMQNSMMGLDGWKLIVMNTAAFAPIPLMLFFFNKINKKYGIKWALRVGLICFIVAMSLFELTAIPAISAISNLGFYIGLTAGTIGSFAIGAFFTIPYVMPAQIAAEEAVITGINRAGMYFGAQGLVNQIVGAIAGTVVLTYVLNIVNFFGQEVKVDRAVFIAPIVILACILAFIFAKNLPGVKFGKGKKVKGEPEKADEPLPAATAII